MSLVETVWAKTHYCADCLTLLSRDEHVWCRYCEHRHFL